MKTSSDLKYFLESKGTAQHFFSRESMKFFGDTMQNYGVRDAGDCWELYRRKPVKEGLRNSTYFDKETGKRCFKREGN